MAAIDTVHGLDWSEATYIGDGVYLVDSTRHTGVASVALRADVDYQNFVNRVGAGGVSGLCEQGDRNAGGVAGQDLMLAKEMPDLGAIYSSRQRAAAMRRAAWIARCRNASTTDTALCARCASPPKMRSAWQSSPLKN